MAKLGAAFPTSKYAELAGAQVDMAAMAWAEALPEVPEEAVEELYRRVVRGWAITFPPTIGDFRKSWDDWDYWVEQNAADDGPVLNALPMPPPNMDAPGPTGYRLQGEFFRAAGFFVTCECLNQIGISHTAVLSSDKTRWICATGTCRFSLLVTDTDKAPDRGRAKIYRGSIGEAMGAPVTQRERPADKGPNELQRAALACNVDLSALEPLQLARFRAFIKWWNEKYTSPLTRDHLDEYFPAWLIGHQEREAQAMQK